MLSDDAARPHPSGTNPDRPQKRSTRRQTVQAAGWVKKPISDEINRIAKAHGLSRSAVIARMLEKGVRRSINAEHADLLEPIIRKSISDALRRDRNRMANLLIRSTAQVSQIRHLLINLLGRAGSPRKVTAEQLNKILDWSRKQAREDIIRRSPATEELIKAVSAWMDGDAGGEEETAT